MKKLIKNAKGFAMAELLAVSIVILLIFSVLVSNYLPLVAEYENRDNYTNVTANYASFYIRKIYKSLIENNYEGSVVSSLDNKLNNDGYYTIYNQNSSEGQIILPLTYGIGNDPTVTSSLLLDIINEYGIEEAIITRYKTATVKSKYAKSDGKLYNYIQYLPTYNNSSYGTSGFIEPYRLIIKTKDFGYATTQIIPDPPTPLSCFNYEMNGSSLTIASYKSLESAPSECKEHYEDVIVDSNKITVAGCTNCYVTQIKSDAFKGKGIKSIDLPNTVTTIGDSAFENNNIKRFNFTTNAPGVINVGNNAFRSNSFTDIIVPQNVNFGNGVFSNNYNLKTITFDYNDYSENQNVIISDSMFALDVNDDILNKRNEIDLYIPDLVNRIGDKAFQNLKISELNFGGLRFAEGEANEEGEALENEHLSRLSSIGESAFRTDDDSKVFQDNNSNYLEVVLPLSVQIIEDYAFQNLKIGDLTFEDYSNHPSLLRSIGASAFKFKNKVDVNKINNKNIFIAEDGVEYKRDLKLPVSIQTIGESAFENQSFDSVSFEDIIVNYNNDGDVIGEVVSFQTLSDGTKITSNINSIGQKAFSGNNLKSLVFPLTKSLSIGKNIFFNNLEGDDEIGNEVGSLVVRNEELFDGFSDMWCDALYGVVSPSCTCEINNSNPENPEIGAEPLENDTYICNINGQDKKKYINYISLVEG